MAKLQIKVLEKEEEDLIHEQSLKSLEEIGVMIHSKSVLKILEKSGAEVTYNNEIAKIPEGLVYESLKKAPKRITYYSRDNKHNLEIPVDNFPFTATNGLAINISDLETGKYRPSTREDLANFSKLGDALSQVDYLWTSLTATEVPQGAHGAHEIWTTLQNTTKHVEGVTVLNSVDARKQIELASLIVGGEDELRRRPIISIMSCPIAPLTFEKGSIEAQVEFAKAGVPVVSMSMSLGGMSSPVTLAGMITNINTENLASLVIDQVAAPGSRHVYSSESTPIDMKTGVINYNAPELPLISAATGQMAKRYDLPCMVAGWGSNANQNPGIFTAFSQLVGGTLSALAGTDLAAGMGSIDVAKGCSCEQLVIDAFLWEHVRSFMRDFTVTEDTIALDVVKEVGHGNSFLTHPHTAKNFRNELFFFDNEKLAWEATLSDKMVPNARKIAKKLLREHDVPQIDRDIIKQGDELIREYERTLKTP